jgi:hypothetical protein
MMLFMFSSVQDAGLINNLRVCITRHTLKFTRLAYSRSQVATLSLTLMALQASKVRTWRLSARVQAFQKPRARRHCLQSFQAWRVLATACTCGRLACIGRIFDRWRVLILEGKLVMAHQRSRVRMLAVQCLRQWKQLTCGEIVRSCMLRQTVEL